MTPPAGLRRRVLVLTCLIGTGLTSAVHGEAGEYELKAAFIHNFARMVKWTDTSASDALTVCVVESEDSEGEATATIYRQIDGEEAQGLPIQVTSWDEDEICAIVFFVAGAGAEIGGQASSLAEERVLTIGETDTFARDGGVINFVTIDSKIRFEINPAAAERSGLVVNSQLIRLATIVGDEDERS